MSAEDNLSGNQFKLYHGSNTHIKVPGMVEARLQGFDNNKDIVGKHVAFATTDLSEAQLYGKNVYEVEPDEHTEKFSMPNVYISKKGFKIKSKLPVSRPRTFAEPKDIEPRGRVKKSVVKRTPPKETKA